MLALGKAPLLRLPDSLLSCPVINCEPATAFTACCWRTSRRRSAPPLHRKPMHWRRYLLLASTLLATVKIAPFAEARTPLLAPNTVERLTVPLPPSAVSTPVVTREMVTRSASKETPPEVVVTLIPTWPTFVISVFLTSTEEPPAANATSMPLVVKP